MPPKRGQAFEPSSKPPVGEPVVAPEATVSPRTTRGAASSNPLSQLDDKIAALRAEGLKEVPNYYKLFEATRKAKEIAAPYVDDFNKALRPYARAEEAANINRELKAREALDNERAYETLKSGRGRYDLATQEGLQFAEDIELGKASNVPFVEALRRVNDESWERTVSERPDAAGRYIANYLPHMFKNPDAALEVMQRLGLTKAAFGGKGGGLYARTLRGLTMKQIIEGGKRFGINLEPVTNDLVDLTLMRVREMNKFVTASRLIKELNQKGLGRFIHVDDEVPAGYRSIDTKIIAPTTEGGSARAQFIAPEPVARLINNQLAPGLRGSKIFGLYRNLGNTLNMAQLGWSFFHGTMTTLLASVSEVSNALLQTRRGNVAAALGSAIKAPIAALDYWNQGSKLLKEAFAPGTQGADMATWLDRLMKAGGRVRMDEFYRTGGPEAFIKAFRQKSIPGMAGSILPAVGEIGATPVLKWYVPRLKLGAFMSIAKEELARLPEDATPEMEHAALSRAWDSVDNRFGQLVYDNLFWNKTLKDLSLATVRSVGWNLGTIRELGGGIADLARGRATQKGAFFIALPMTIGLVGGVLHYLMTGKPPEELRDYFYPATGNWKEDGSPERIQAPSYVRDEVDYATRPWQTIKNKVHPALRMVADMLDNKDFYNQPIRNTEHPLVQQLLEEAKYIGSQYIPIAERTDLPFVQRGNAPPLSTTGKVAYGFGFTPAPKSVTEEDLTKTPEQVRLGKLNPAQREEEEERSKDKRQLQLAGSRIRKIMSNKNIPEDEKRRLVNDINQRRQAAAADMQKRARRLIDLTRQP